MAVTESPPLSTCTVRIERRGGRGEAGARALERHLQDISGVHDADISFRTGSARITYDEAVTSEETIRDAVRDRDVSIQDDRETATDDVSTRSELRREAVFVGLTLLGMVTGLVTGWLDGPSLLMWAGYGVAYVFGGWYGLKGAIETLRHGAVDIDLLMIVAALGALSIGAPFEGAMLLFLFSLSNTLQHYAIGRSRRAIKSLVEMRPDEAQVLRDGEEVTVPIDDVAVGDVFVVRPGDKIPLDGVVTSGEGTVDQASLTGESVPVPKEPGDEVFGGTINESGSLEIEVTRQAHESAISRLIHMVERAQSEKAPTQRLIDRLEQPYVLGVFGLTIAAIAIPLALGGEFTSTFYRAMTLMVAASPCAVIISTPAAVLSAIASGGRQGVLFKGGMASHPGFHSLHDETAASISVTGGLPEWLRGSLVRNGPGAFSLPNGSSVDHWFDGFAMLYRFTFDPDSDAVHYRNRFLRTDAYEAATSGEFEGGFATGETTLRSRLATFLTDPYDNTNIIAERFGREYVALTESPRKVRFDPNTLETVGHVEHADGVPTGQLSCAHVKRDPTSGVLVNVETAFGRTSQYHVTAMSPDGTRRHVGSVDTDQPAYMHSFALTPRYVVLTEFPLRLDPRRFLKPGRQAPFIEQFEWDPDRGTRIIVMDRTTGTVVAEPVIDAVFGFHHVNAFERAGGRELVFDLETVPDATTIDSLYLDNLRAGEMGAIVGRIERFTVDLGTGSGVTRYGGADVTVSREMLYPDGSALPTVSPARWCRPHRYVYAMGMDTPVTEWARRVLKLDTDTGAVETFDDGGDYFGEPVFVPAPDGHAEDDGVVLVVALDADADRSRLLVLDAQTFAERARATLPHAAPFDFHGRYFPELRVAAGN